MSNDYNSLVEQARQRPNSTAAIAVIAIETHHYQRAEARKQAVKSFFGKIFGKNS